MSHILQMNYLDIQTIKKHFCGFFWTSLLLSQELDVDFALCRLSIMTTSCGHNR